MGGGVSYICMSVCVVGGMFHTYICVVGGCLIHLSLSVYVGGGCLIHLSVCLCGLEIHHTSICMGGDVSYTCLCGWGMSHISVSSFGWGMTHTYVCVGGGCLIQLSLWVGDVT